MVAGGHTTEVPKTHLRKCGVKGERLDHFNDLEVKVADIQNAYLTAPLFEKIWTILGPGFGSDSGKIALIVHALDASFKNHLANYLHKLRYVSCKAKAGIWLKAKIKPGDRFKYYNSYIICYVDDVLYVHHDAMKQI